MADDSVNTKTNKVVMDRITKFFKGKCETSDVAKYQAAIHIKDCDDSSVCWETIACGLEIATPEFIREAIRVEQSATCDIFAAAGQANTVSWATYRMSDTAEMGEWSQDFYFSSDRSELMQEWLESGQPKIIVIDVNDPDRSQFSFMALLTSWNGQFSASSDTEVSMLPATFQPTGAPMFTKGEQLMFCD